MSSSSDSSESSSDDVQSLVLNALNDDATMNKIFSSIYDMFDTQSDVLVPEMPFCSLGINLVPVHPDVINEPYATNGIQLHSDRPYFSFDQAAYCCTVQPNRGIQPVV